MASIKVLLIDQSGNQYDVSYIQEIPMSLNLLIADIRNPEKRNTTFSKTILFPATKELNIFFESVWQCNVSLQTFNPNLKCGIYYYIDEVEQLRGDLQLLKIKVDGDGASIQYETSAKGRLSNLFTEIGDKFLTDIDLSAYDHVLSKANVTASWVAAVGSGYVYPIIDYGYNQVNTDSEIHVKYLRPAIYKKEILDKIFLAAGKTYTSTYFNSSYFKSQIIPATEENILIAQSDIDNSQFFARRNANQTGTANAATFGTSWTFFNGVKDVVLFNEDNVAPYNDAGGQYATGTGVFTVGNTNTYNAFAKVKFDLVIANTVGTATNVNVSFGQVFVDIQKWNGSNWTTIIAGQNATGFGGAYPSLTLSGEVYVPLSGTFTSGDLYRVVVYPFNFQFTLFTAGMVAVTTGTTTVTPVAKTNSQFASQLQSTIVTEGYTIEVNQAIPTNIKQIDWLMTEFKAANLYMDVDKNNDNNYIIEPREADSISTSPGFYSGEVDWTQKLDTSIDFDVLPMGDLDFKRREFTYKQDSDEFNEAYNKSYKEVFGFKYIDITNDFITGVNKTELIYSPTPIVGNALNGLIIPKIRKNDNGTYKNFKANIRSLYYGGVINLSFGNWTLKSSSGDTTYSTYPFAGDCDNPYAPTFTLNWNTPHAVYYNYILSTYTDNNLYNRFYSRQVNQVSDKNSKIVRAYFDLDKSDIKEFDFRKVVFVGAPLDAYFLVNSISNYDVINRKSTMVELLKLADYDTFTPSLIDAPPEDDIGNERIINGNYSNGENNSNYGTASHIVGGSGNYIAPGATNIQLRNCTNVSVAPDVENFVGDGLSNRTITSAESNTVTKQNSPSVTITGDTTIDASYNGKTVFVDGTAGNIIITTDVANMVDCDITFIRTDATGSNIDFVDVDAIVTINGNATPYTVMPNQYDKLRLFFNTNIFIL